jgi:choline dehydrogenase-like flavoprotein
VSSADIFAPGADPVPREAPERVDCDVAIVGSGIGGATLAWALRDSGARVLVLERGDFLPREWQNWSPREVHQRRRYSNSDAWVDARGRAFVPGNYHYVGGSSKFYGATMLRLRETDFDAVEHHDGISPPWPVGYAELERFYAEAERLYWVHGGAGDPTEPWRSTPYPHPPLDHEPPVAEIAERLRARGLHPFPLPQAVDRGPGGACVLCRTCDAYPCLVDAKGDADLAAMRPALRSPTVRLLTRAHVTSIESTPDGAAVRRLRALRDDRPLEVHAARFVLSAGAVNTAALLLRSGVANSSGMVGRNYMSHNSSFVVGVRPGRAHELVFQKTLGINDWYLAGEATRYPLGNVQALGKLQGPMIKAARRRLPLSVLEWSTRRSIDFYVQSEDLPRPDNRVVLDSAGRVQLLREATNVVPHRTLVRHTTRLLRACGYPFVFTERLGIEATAHQCGTARMGDDPGASVVDRDCRSHDLRNLWIVDASTFPSSAGVNPALTIAALALRVGASGALVA